LVSILVARNTVQSVDVEVTKEGRVTNAATGLYTVPSGKVARVKSITARVETVGGDATYAAAITRGANTRAVADFVAVDKVSAFNGELLLQAADIITNIGDSGATNGTIDMTATVKEFDA